jgi:phosphomannomutase
MSTIPQIKEITDLIMETLIMDGFFVDYEITNQAYAEKRFSDELTKKFLSEGLDDDGDYFSEEEYHQILNEIAEKFANEEVDTTDGVKIYIGSEWVHLRKSNTEPTLN